MLPIVQQSSIVEDSSIVEYLRKSEGRWRSERRYYTLPDGDTQEMLSFLSVRFLERGCPELVELAKRHELSDPESLLCGSEVTWKSETVAGRQQSEGSTVFGVRGTIMYRDRGFATPKPVTALFSLPNPHTLCLRTEYNDSVFEEELKQIGHNYRTRQTIISRAGEEKMIGQYLEKRIQLK